MAPFGREPLPEHGGARVLNEYAFTYDDDGNKKTPNIFGNGPFKREVTQLLIGYLPSATDLDVGKLDGQHLRTYVVYRNGLLPLVDVEHPETGELLDKALEFRPLPDRLSKTRRTLQPEKIGRQPSALPA